MCAIDSEIDPDLESKSFPSSQSLMARLAIEQNLISILTTTSLIMGAILKSPPPCLGSANDNSSRMLASSLAKSYRVGNVGRHGIAMPFSSTDTASGKRYSSGENSLLLHSLKKAVWSASNPVDVPSKAFSPCNATHSGDVKTANVRDEDVEEAPARVPNEPSVTSSPAAVSTWVQASALAPKKTPPTPAASSALPK